MKKVILLIIILIFLTGCSGLYNLSLFTIPNDNGFISLIQGLDTPEKICQYMQDNFIFELNTFLLDPYQLYVTRKGDCNDFAIFGVFFANCHNYETYQIAIFDEDIRYNHCLAIYKENNSYNFSDNQHYFTINAINFKEIVEYDYCLRGNKWIKYKVYDFDMNIVEIGYND